MRRHEAAIPQPPRMLPYARGNLSSLSGGNSKGRIAGLLPEVRVVAELEGLEVSQNRRKQL